ncbi:MAG: family 43 glycosylhydrolase [Clostridia bacterium]
MNPLLHRKYFIPDAEAHVMPDGRLYLYGSSDISGKKEYCGSEYRVFSTDDPDLSVWTDHGVSFRNTREEAGIPWKPGVPLYAPDAIYRDGKFYLYACGQDSFEAAAVSETPYGPFSNAEPIEGADGDGIDPAVFIDDGGQAYYLWGQFSLKGGKLCKDMKTLEKESVVSGILTEQEHGFHEGASMRKRNGKYYIVYTDISRGKATCLSYAVSDRPLGPYRKGGVIIDNIYCDPQTWNNHGSIEEYKGKWYVFYHRSSQNGCTCRRVCAEPIFFQEDGSIPEVEMTSQGASGPISAFLEVDASIACRMKGNLYIAPEPSQNNEFNEILTNCGGGNWTQDWAEYRYLDFSDGAEYFTIRARGKGNIIILSADHLIAGKCAIDSEEFTTYQKKLDIPLRGVRPLWLLFDGRKMSVDSFYFQRRE